MLGSYNECLELLPKLQFVLNNLPVPVYHPAERLAPQGSTSNPPSDPGPDPGSQMPTLQLFKWKFWCIFAYRAKWEVVSQHVCGGSTVRTGCCHNICLECKWNKATAETKHGWRSHFYCKTHENITENSLINKPDACSVVQNTKSLSKTNVFFFYLPRLLFPPFYPPPRNLFLTRYLAFEAGLCLEMEILEWNL